MYNRLFILDEDIYSAKWKSSHNNMNERIQLDFIGIVIALIAHIIHHTHLCTDYAVVNRMRLFRALASFARPLHLPWFKPLKKGCHMVLLLDQEAWLTATLLLAHQLALVWLCSGGAQRQDEGKHGPVWDFIALEMAHLAHRPNQRTNSCQTTEICPTQCKYRRCI